jgi:hypothetical protein
MSGGSTVAKYELAAGAWPELLQFLTSAVAADDVVLRGEPSLTVAGGAADHGA